VSFSVMLRTFTYSERARGKVTSCNKANNSQERSSKRHGTNDVSILGTGLVEGSCGLVRKRWKDKRSVKDARPGTQEVKEADP